MRTLSSRKQSSITRNSRFFLVNLSHDTLVNYYNTTYQLIQNHKYSLTELELMIPWEREVYLSMLVDQLKAQAEEQQRQNMQR